jgi:hypothetical protein
MQSVTAAGGYPVSCSPPPPSLVAPPPSLVAPPSLVKVTVQVDPDTTTVETTPPCAKVPQ